VPGGANKTQIVYESGLNFQAVVSYLELITRNGLAERTEGGVTRYKTTAKGAKRSAFQGAEETMVGTHATDSGGLAELGSD
jgi:predicted transcriptional regulator